jgi:hypothetical protein
VFGHRRYDDENSGSSVVGAILPAAAPASPHDCGHGEDGRHAPERLISMRLHAWSEQHSRDPKSIRAFALVKKMMDRDASLHELR